MASSKASSEGAGIDLSALGWMRPLACFSGRLSWQTLLGLLFFEPRMLFAFARFHAGGKLLKRSLSHEREVF